ncbi:MAG: FAD:protein FMN transferase [Asticcacaulis sp.]|uniref:FAD:protein FMN transferase n=1 Tax=Asticcacaulis sp. TaxID=1872648 RepID=UPI0039E3FFDB
MSLPLPALDRRVLIPDLVAEPHPPVGTVRHDLGGSAFATTWRVSFHAEADAVLLGLPARLQAVLDGIDREMSPYRIDSDLTRFNLAPAGTFVALPARMMTVIRHALATADLTDGAFDPAILPAVELWGFGAKAVPEGLPDTSVLSPGRWRDLVWQADGMIKPADVRLDLCAIAKGYAVDALMDLLKAEPGVRSALIEVGGELKGWNVQPDGLPFWVEIETPAMTATVAALCDLAVATSGERVRSFVHEGQVHSHIIDSRTQAPTRSGIVSVTVFDAECWRADALATALMVMGEAKAMAFAATSNIPCLVWLREGDGFREAVSPRLEAWL